MSNLDPDALVEHALELWRQHYSNNFAEIRALWYPSKTPGLHSGWRAGHDAWEDLEAECEHHIVEAVEGAVAGMSPTMRAALENHCGLCRVFRHIRDYEWQLKEAKLRIYRSILAAGMGL